MKLLYGIQGTGHGHISRAREILPHLSKTADVDILLSGYNCKLNLDGFRVIKKRGISFEYDSRGGVSVLETARSLHPVKLLQDIQELDTDQYDLIISDYEPITSWASMASQVPCVGLSHQAAFLSDRCPRPDKRSVVAEQILKHFAPCTRPLGFHFRKYDSFIEPPVIRSQIKNLNPVQENYITVYLPAFDHETLASVFLGFDTIRWQIFSPFCTETYTRNHITVHPLGNETFLKSLANCSGVITSAGFETCAEAMYLGKKLFVIPIKNQYEQLCNAAALEKMGICVAQNWGDALEEKLRSWLSDYPVVQLDEIADVERVADKLLRMARRMNRRKYALQL